MIPTLVWTTWFIPMIVKSWIDKHQRGINIHEGAQKYIQIIAVIAVAILHGIFVADVHTPKDWVPDQYTIAVMLFYPFSWMAFFDAIYNAFIKKPWNFIGTTAGTDRVFQRAKGTLYYSVKIFSLIVTLACIIIIYQEYV